MLTSSTFWIGVAAGAALGYFFLAPRAMARRAPAKQGG